MSPKQINWTSIPRKELVNFLSCEVDVYLTVKEHWAKILCSQFYVINGQLLNAL
uniref:Uncharacterized protein n=1 Tax=Arundo donax TaxID=35708 RepID=A0A0A9AGH1_ARUDO